jgi:hypothetical protein
MYPYTFGGSALLHILAAHPRVVAFFGIAATVSMLISPLGPGRYSGTARRLEQLEASVKVNNLVTAERQAKAERAATSMLERAADAEIAAAVDYTLHRCGSGCTDLSTPTVVADPELLRRVLVLYDLDTSITAPVATSVAASTR